MFEYAFENIEFAPTKQLLAMSTHQAFFTHRLRKFIHDNTWFGRKIDFSEASNLLAHLRDMNLRFYRRYFSVVEQRISSLKADDYISVFRNLFYSGIAEGCLNETIFNLVAAFEAKNESDSDRAKVSQRKTEVMFAFARLKISEEGLK